jgi:hypothetical protein
MAYQALVATVWPLRTPLLGSLADRISAFLATAVAARYYARNLLLDASTRCAGLEAKPAAELAVARRQLADSIAAITTALAADGTAGETGRPAGQQQQRAGQYVRSASLFAHVADVLPEQGPVSRPQLALRDLELLDGALAEAARWAGVPVTALDTAAAQALAAVTNATRSGWGARGALEACGTNRVPMKNGWDGSSSMRGSPPVSVPLTASPASTIVATWSGLSPKSQ